jgi:cobalt-zinc-cadmium efflux system protein
MPRDTRLIERRFILSLALTGTILIAEVLGGLWTGSLALLSDAAHIFLDILALAMSYAALRIAARPADDRHTYGYHRWQVIAALTNGATLLVVAFGIFREAWHRFQTPAPILAGPMLIVAAIGLVVNLLVALALSDHDHGDLNVRSAFLHVLGDALSSVGVIVAGVVILLTGWLWVDPLVSVLIGVIILAGSGRVLREALHILVEGAPDGVTTAQVRPALRTVPGVSDVHDLHIWTVSPGYVALSAHVVLTDASFTGAHDIQGRIRALLAERFGIQHTTVQLECAHCGQGIVTCANEL